MPCRDSYTDNDVRYVENPVNRELKERLDNVTELLCYSLEKVENGTTDLFYTITGQDKDTSQLDRELIDWWEDHKKVDEEERLKHLAENAKQLKAMRIMAKLNEEFSEEEIEELKDLI
jgi:hypothetical protein